PSHPVSACTLFRNPFPLSVQALLPYIPFCRLSLRFFVFISIGPVPPPAIHRPPAPPFCLAERHAEGQGNCRAGGRTLCPDKMSSKCRVKNPDAEDLPAARSASGPVCAVSDD